MPDLYKKLGLWSTNTSALLGNLHAVQGLGFEYLVVRLVVHPNGPAVPYQADVLRQLVTDAATIDLPVCGWAYVYPTNIEQQIAAIAAAMPESIGNLVLDAEIEWENLAAGAASAHDLFHGLAEQTGHRAALHLSSFYNPDSHPLPYSAFLAHCESFMPQAYRIPPTSVATVMSRTLEQDPPLSHQSLGGKLVATVNRPEMLAAVAAHPDTFDGANVWLWDGSGSDIGVSGHEPDWTSAIAAYHAAFSG